MSAVDENSSLVRAFFQARNRQEPDHADRYLHPAFVRHSPPPLSGIEAYKEWLSALKTMWSDEVWTILDMAADSDRVWVLLRNESTHSGTWHGLAATGRRVTFETLNIFRIREGRIAEMWRVADDWSRVRQLGGSISWPA